MPLDEMLKARTNATLSRVAGEVEIVKNDRVRHAQCAGESARMLSDITDSNAARTHLLNFSARAVKLAECYAANASNLRDDAAISNELMAVNWRLSFFYCLTAISKITDVIYGANPAVKVVITAKNSFCELVTGMAEAKEGTRLREEGRPASSAGELKAMAQAANLTMLGLGKDVTNFTEGIDELRETFEAIVGLLSDGIEVGSNGRDAVESRSDISKFFERFKKDKPKMAELVLKLGSIPLNLEALWKLRLGSKVKAETAALAASKVKGIGQVASKAALEKAEQMGNLLGAIKSGAEAVINLWRAVESFMDFWESWEARDQANSLSDKQLKDTGLKLNLDDIAKMSKSDEMCVIYSLDTEGDARRLAIEAFNKAKSLQVDAGRMQNLQKTMAANLRPLSDKLDESCKHLRATDRELERQRKEFQATEPGRTVYSLEVAVWLSDIDSKRARIAEVLN